VRARIGPMNGALSGRFSGARRGKAGQSKLRLFK
jgi:hypothetical protein